ncbi:hypothetical protein LSH36_193g00037 [Paralvinella palmiformis]|uniref:DUF7043 domain-containing protein n=1 Tax=Paralvinella palmiformis TaxID=53620 RepID=A0AAD9JQB5_9ANNE|nr:hypothetical protein LSH36_193g00037 [Paralvinella palmiformis]
MEWEKMTSASGYMIHSITVVGVVMATFSLLGASCRFPDFLRNTGSSSDRSWFYERTQGSATQTWIVVFGSENAAKLIGGDEKQRNTLHLICLRHLTDNDRYLIREINRMTSRRNVFYFGSNGTASYTCMVFTRRTSNVVTIRRCASTGIQTPGLCTGNNTLDITWLLIANFPTERPPTLPCPLVGGFLFVASQDGTILCDDQPYPSLLHSECLPGDGIRLSFSHPSCIPHSTGWRTDQTFTCAAAWRDSNFIYGLLAERHQQPKWVFRISEDDPDDDVYQMIISQGLQLPRDVRPPPETGLVELNLTRIDDDSECRDGAEVCATEICQQTIYSQLCPHTCAKCDDMLLNTPANKSCQFKKKLQGKWTRHTDHDVSYVTIDDDVIIFEGYDQFYCLKQHDEDFYLITTKLENGCRPRYACINLVKNTAIVMTYQIGKLAYTLPRSGADLCQIVNFNDIVPIAEHRDNRVLYRGIVVDDYALPGSTTLCQLEGQYTLQVYWRDWTNLCVGSLTDGDPDYGPDTMILKLRCTKGNRDIITEVYSCISHIFLNLDKAKVILTRSMNNGTSDRLNCWIFNRQRSGRINLTVLTSPQCDEGSVHDVIGGARSFLMFGNGTFETNATNKSTDVTVTSYTETTTTDANGQETERTSLMTATGHHSASDIIRHPLLTSIVTQATDDDVMDSNKIRRVIQIVGLTFVVVVSFSLIAAGSYVTIRVRRLKSRRYSRITWRMVLEEEEEETL